MRSFARRRRKVLAGGRSHLKGLRGPHNQRTACQDAEKTRRKHRRPPDFGALRLQAGHGRAAADGTCAELHACAPRACTQTRARTPTHPRNARTRTHADAVHAHTRTHTHTRDTFAQTRVHTHGCRGQDKHTNETVYTHKIKQPRARTQFHISVLKSLNRLYNLDNEYCPLILEACPYFPDFRKKVLSTSSIGKRSIPQSIGKARSWTRAC